MAAKQLTPDQLAAVNTDARACLLIAPPGSGKTEVLARRVERLLNESPSGSYRILAVTFTVKAAEELTRRLGQSSGDEAWRVDANTVHGMALDWLRRFGTAVGVPGDVVVYTDQADRIEVLRRLVDSFGEAPKDRELAALLDTLDRVRAGIDGISESSSSETQSTPLGMSVHELVESYESALRAARGIDFPGILTKLLELCDADPRIPERFQRTYQHVLVDEGQDLTRAQAELLRRLVGQSLSIFVVADERQAINTWAGGSIDWARYLVGSSSQQLELRHNFRCAESILELASRVAEHFIPPRHDRRAAPGAAPGTVEFETASDEQAEAVRVRQWIDQLLTDGMAPAIAVPGESTDVRPEEIAVIARTRFALDAIQAELARVGLEHAVQSEGADLLTTPEGRIIHALLELKLNNENRPALRRIEEELPGQLTEESQSFVSPIDYAALVDLIAQHRTPVFVRTVLDSDSSPAGLESLLSTLRSELPQVADTDRYWSWWAEYRAGTQERDRSLRSFLTFLLRVQQARLTERGVRLLTAHRSKGLEFKAVALIGLTEGNFPDFRARTSEDIDAERRVFYVSITRASRLLLLTWPQRRQTRYGSRGMIRSRFLSEAGLPV